MEEIMKRVPISLFAVSCLTLTHCSDTIIHKHYHLQSDAEPMIDEVDAEAPLPSRDCRFAADACAPGFTCEQLGEGYECVPAPLDIGVSPNPVDMMAEPSPDMTPDMEPEQDMELELDMEPELDMMPLPTVEVYPEDVGPIQRGRLMGEFGYAPAFDGDGQRLESFSLSDFRTNDERWGEYEYLVIMVGAEWCTPCRDRLDALEEGAADFEDSRALFLYVMMEDRLMDPANSTASDDYLSRFIEDLRIIRVGPQSKTHTRTIMERLRDVGLGESYPQYLVVRRSDSVIVNDPNELLGTAEDFLRVLRDAPNVSEYEPPDPSAPAHELTDRCADPPLMPSAEPKLLTNESWVDALCFQDDFDLFAAGASLLGGFTINLRLLFENSFGRENEISTAFYAYSDQPEELTLIEEFSFERAEDEPLFESVYRASIDRPVIFSVGATNENAALEYTVEVRYSPLSVDDLCSESRDEPWVDYDEEGRVMINGLSVHNDAICEFSDADEYLVSPPEDILYLMVYFSEPPETPLDEIIIFSDPETLETVDVSMVNGLDTDRSITYEVSHPVIMTVSSPGLERALYQIYADVPEL